MKRYILHIFIFIAALLAADVAWGQTTTNVGNTWNGGNLANNTIYKLSPTNSTKTVTLSGQITIPSGTTVTIDLNGCVLRGGGIGEMINVKGTLTIIDSSDRTSQHKGKLNEYGLWIPDNSGTIILKGGTICPTYYNVSTNRKGIELTPAGERQCRFTPC